jgi:hypothetical protein
MPLNHRRTRDRIAIALLAAVAATSSIPPSAAETPATVSMAEQPPLDPKQWCRPVVHAAIDPAPLSCWLTLTESVEPGQPISLAGMNLGDLPPWSDIDVEAIAAELDRFQQQVEAQNRQPILTRPPTGIPKPDRIAAPGASPLGDLQERCMAGNYNACLQLFQSGGAGGPAPGTAPAPAPAPEEDVELIDWDDPALHEAHRAYIAELDRRLLEAIAAQCPDGGGGTWTYRSGQEPSFYVVCY